MSADSALAVSGASRAFQLLASKMKPIAFAPLWPSQLSGLILTIVVAGSATSERSNAPEVSHVIIAYSLAGKTNVRTLDATASSR